MTLSIPCDLPALVLAQYDCSNGLGQHLLYTIWSERMGRGCELYICVRESVGHIMDVVGHGC
jgi:hypothetical protein